VSALTSEEFFAGETKALKRISLENGFVATVAKDFVPPPTVMEEKAKAPQNEKEVNYSIKN
jgi:indole-3-glycerol phosphate synthase